MVSTCRVSFNRKEKEGQTEARRPHAQQEDAWMPVKKGNRYTWLGAGSPWIIKYYTDKAHEVMAPNRRGELGSCDSGQTGAAGLRVI